MRFNEYLVEVLEVTCPTHGRLYDEFDWKHRPMLPIDARKLRDGTIEATCKPCESDGHPKPHTHLLWATKPLAELADAGR